MTAGIVIYQEVGAGLSGTWTHGDIGGKAAVEKVAGASLSALAGDWAVTIWLPAGVDPFFTGTLHVEALGAAWLLRWTGNQGPDQQAVELEGTGLILADLGILAATFESKEGDQSRHG